MKERDDAVQLGAFERTDTDYYQMYLEELKAVAPCSAEEQEMLLKALAEGKREAEGRLTEGKLLQAVRLAERYRDRGLPMSDLVQEANMALLLAVKEYETGDFDSFMEHRVCSALELALEDQNRELQIEEEMTARVNVLNDISAAMARELGREATVEELAERMKMSEEEIRDIMKLALDAVNVSGQ